MTPFADLQEPPVFAVETLVDRRLLVIRYAGYVRQSDVDACFDAVARALKSFRPDFRLLVDLTGLRSMETSCRTTLTRIMDLCDAHGVSLVIRVIPDPARDIGLQILSCFHYGPSVRTVTHTSLEAANAALADE